MLIKEYRIILPFDVEEYRRAQLYMVAKFSKNHTGNGEGVEILVNEPFEDANGKGQFTHKIIHIGSRIPGWLRYMIPTSVLTIEEKAWNAYPYCKTIYTSPFLGEKFSMEIETKYLPDKGDKNNVFSGGKDVEIDFVDIVNDPIDPSRYNEAEDPAKYHSVKSGRGPLSPNWRDNTKPIMCCYKMCRVEFKYWGLQTKVESFIHKMALRDVFLLGHRQIVCWLDEWWDLSMDDIRKFENETKEALSKALHDESDK